MSGFRMGVSRGFGRGMVLVAISGTVLLAGRPLMADPGPYLLDRMGLHDAEHTRDDGHQHTEIRFVTPSGAYAGHSTRFQSSIAHGQSAWVFDPWHATVRIGFRDAAHTHSDGTQHSTVVAGNAAGLIAGHSTTYIGAEVGRSAWLYNTITGSTIDISRLDLPHVAGNGRYLTTISALNDAGQVAGVSSMFDGDADRGMAAWLRDPDGAFARIGYFDTLHTSSTGTQDSTVRAMNQAGQVVGHSSRYSGSTWIGTSGWLYDPSAGHAQLGLFDAEHTNRWGHMLHMPEQINASGHVAGYSRRYINDEVRGESAWVRSPGGQTVRVGLSDVHHTRESDGYRRSFTHYINDSGQVAGASERYAGQPPLGFGTGQSAWIYTPGEGTERIGLLDAAHHRWGLAYHNTALFGFNEAGQAIGRTARFNGGDYIGQSAWIHQPGSEAMRIGLVDAAHTREDGFQFSTPIALNAQGHVIGFSNRYPGGSSGWFYDPASDQTFPLVFSVREDGVASSTPSFLGEDGVVLGRYSLYDGMDSLGNRAFYWTMGEGFHDLGGLIEGGLESSDWERLYNAIQLNGIGQIAGYGRPDGHPASTQAAFLLTPLGLLLPGDANRDGRVDGEDFLIWQANFGMQDGAGWTQGDFNGDGRVDGEDFLIWQASFGSGAANSAPVPEPAAAGILLMLGVLLRRRMR